MQAQQAERTRQMKERYVELHDQGLSIQEIAQQFHLSDSTVYKSLDEIAAKAGVDRDSLLQIPHSSYTRSPQDYSPVRPIDTRQSQAHAKALYGNLHGLTQDLSRHITTLEAISQSFEKEEQSWQEP